MGPRAEVGEGPVAVEGDLLPFGNARDDVELEAAGSLTRGEGGQFAALTHGEGLIAGDDLALERLGLGNDGGHLLLDPLEILRRDPVREIDVVVEAVVDRGSGSELGLGPDAEDRRGEDVRRGVAEGFQFGHGRGEKLKAKS